MILGDLIRAFEGQATLDDFKSCLHEQLIALGFDHVTLGILPRRINLAPPMPRNISTYPQEWLTRYEENRYLFVDPSISKPLRNPQRWFYWHERQGLSAEETRVLDEATEFGLRQGLCLPIPTSQAWGMMALSWTGSANELLQFLDGHRSRLWLLANAALYMAARQFRHELTEPYQDLLNNQEHDLLRWISDGQNLESIADRLNLSLPSVRQRLEILCRKLDVASPAEALVVTRELLLH